MVYASRTSLGSGPTVEPLEARCLLSAEAAVQSSPPPTVTGGFIGGTAWARAFKQHLERIGGGDADYGCWWFGPESGPLPWVNVNQITLTFSADMVVEARHLRVFGTNVPEYPVTSLTYRVNPLNFNGIATWTLARPLTADKILLQLDAHSPDGVRMAGNPFDPPLLDGDRDGQPGGDYRLRFESLPGDFGGTRTVSQAHVVSLRREVGTSVESLGTWPNDYHVMSDVNGDSRINVTDLAEVRRRVGTTLPYWEPSGLTAAQASAPSRTRPVTRGLFSTQPVLS
jgi:hypothetical protein